MKTLKYLAASALVCLTFSLSSSAQDTAAVKKENPNAAEITFENGILIVIESRDDAAMADES